MDDRPFFIREPKWQLVFLVIFGFIVYMILNARLGGVDKNSVAIAFDLLIFLVSRELTNYITSLTLTEFLAQVDLPDQPSAQAQTIAFRSRPQLTQRFFEAEFRQMAANSGLQLNWIDVGTWVAPAALIPAKYLDAWKINVENQIRQQNIALLERETRLEEMLRLVREVPLISYRRSQAQGTLDEDIRIEIIADYLGTLRAAQAVMPIQVYPTERAQLDAAINYLGDYIRRHSSRAGLVRFLEPPAD